MPNTSQAINKTFAIEVVEQRKDGGRILINTASLDRDRDRVMPNGARIVDYLNNPIVQWGHNYRDPWATVGKTNSLTITESGIVADFTLRPAANDQDPQNVIALLWEGGWVRTASIGFVPRKGAPNAEGGTDFTEWDLLEWSIVPIPANQDALRLAYKGLEAQGGEIVVNYQASEIADREIADRVLDLLGTKSRSTKDATETTDSARAWLRRLTISTGAGKQTVFAAFYKRAIDVPEDATITKWDFYLNECKEEAHPDAGKTVTFKIARFIPAIDVADLQRGYRDSIYSRCVRDCDDQAVLGESHLWEDQQWSDVIDSIDDSAKSKALDLLSIESHFEIETLTANGMQTARKALAQKIARAQAIAKRGRVLSSKNESTIREAQQDARSAADKLDEVLKQLDEQPAASDAATQDQPKQGGDSNQVALLTEGEERDLAASLLELTNLLKGEFTQ